jgi:hypothetical protein
LPRTTRSSGMTDSRLSERAEEIVAAVFAISDRIRYVAIGAGQDVMLRARDDLQDASSATSDRFEELFVNPALLTLARQRGELDCGGLRYLVVGRGNFRRLIVPYGAGHLSVASNSTPTRSRASIASSTSWRAPWLTNANMESGERDEGDAGQQNGDAGEPSKRHTAARQAQESVAVDRD